MSLDLAINKVESFALVKVVQATATNSPTTDTSVIFAEGSGLV